MSETKAPKYEKTCVVCGRRFMGYEYRSTCGLDECLESNKHGIRPFADQLFEEEQIEELDAFTNDALVDELNRRGYGVDVRRLDEKFYTHLDLSDVVDGMFQFGVVSDTHIASVYQQMTYLHTAYDIMEKRGIKKVVHTGDLIEGDGKQYRGQAGEMFIGGLDGKLKYTIQNYPSKPGMETDMIGGSHDYIFLKNAGFDVLANICAPRSDLTNLGYFRADITIDNYDIALIHGTGGWTYARSYRLEKWVDKQNRRSLPDMVLMGHFHQGAYISDLRGTEGFMVPCFQGLTPYLSERNLYPTIGFIIMTLKKLADTDIWTVIPEFVVFKDELKEDF